MNTDPTLSPEEQLNQLLLTLPQNGAPADSKATQRFLSLVRDHELISSLDQRMRRAILTRVRAVRALSERCRYVEMLFVRRIGQDGSYASERDRDTFLALASDPNVLNRLPANVRLQVQQRVFMVRQWQAHAV